MACDWNDLRMSNPHSEIKYHSESILTNYD
jgi:hypothetical protein